MIRLLACYLFFTTQFAQACCAEHDYRLFPIGELDGSILFVEFNLQRNCRMDQEEEHHFFVQGIVRLVQNNQDSLIPIKTVDTLDFKECVCSYDDYYNKTTYDSIIGKAYNKALHIAANQKEFKLATTNNIIFNDSINTEITTIDTDSTYVYSVGYKDLLRIELGMEEIISCYPDKVAEVRNYETDQYTITVVRMRCNWIGDLEKKEYMARFKNIDTAFWKEKVQWHGIAKDYWLISPKE